MNPFILKVRVVIYNIYWLFLSFRDFSEVGGVGGEFVGCWPFVKNHPNQSLTLSE